MPIHYWGDEDFDWFMLSEAMDFIKQEAKKIGLMPIMKEKFGTIRYEFIYLWNREPDGSLTDVGIVRAGSQGEYPTPEQLDKFNGILKKATEKYSAVALEIVDDWVGSLNVNEMPDWMKQYDNWERGNG